MIQKKFYRYTDRIKRNIVEKYKSNIREEINNYQFYLLDKYVDSKKDVLDLGSHDGRVAWMLIDSLNIKPNSIYLTDYLDDKVKQCRLNLRKNEEGFIKIKKEDITNLSFDDDKFDVVTIYGNVLNLIYNPNFAGELHEDKYFTLGLRNSIRVTKPGGVILFTVDIKYSRVKGWTDPAQIKDKLINNFNLQILEYLITAKNNDKDAMMIFACKKNKEEV